MKHPGKNDAAPSGNGAGVNGSNTGESQFTQISARMVPPSPANAPRGTSDAAARSMVGVAPTVRLRVYNFLLECGEHGATDEEGEDALGIRPQSYTPRRGELVTLGAVRDSGRRRRTQSGRSAAVWVAVTTDLRGDASEGGG